MKQLSRITAMVLSIMIPQLLNAYEFPLTEEMIAELRKDIPPLSLTKAPEYPESVYRYFNAYGLNFPDATHFFGFYNTITGKAAAHIFRPESPKGTIIILHGYFDHTGIEKPLISLCLGEGYTTITIDLPGHGLSDGERCAIDDFSRYADTISAFLDNFHSDLPRPIHMIGHSTGCSAGFEYLATTKENHFDRIIFLGPLVRSHLWEPSKAAFFLVRPFIKKLPRKFKKNSGDPEYLALVRKDPLEGRYVSAKWFSALSSWNERITGYTTIHNKTLILQGNLDKTVDWEYNIPFLEKKFSNITVKIIENGRHQLPNEGKEIRKAVFSQISEFLNLCE